MSPITTHVLDTALGHPAEGVPITLLRIGGGEAAEIGSGATNEDGRLADLLEEGALTTGEYLMRFDTGAYFNKLGREAFYPQVEVRFVITDAHAHYHVPLLLSPYGYSTYRGS